eukprot:744245-Hanusia_phi.AAC.2
MVLQLDVGIDKKESKKLPTIEDFFGSYETPDSNLEGKRKKKSPNVNQPSKSKELKDPEVPNKRKKESRQHVSSTHTEDVSESEASSDSQAVEDGGEEEKREEEIGQSVGARDSDEIKEEMLERTLFVGGVPLTCTRKSIKKFFQEFGSIESVRLRSVPTTYQKLPKKTSIALGMLNSERETCNAYVRFKVYQTPPAKALKLVLQDEKSVAKALSKNGSVMDGHRIKVDQATISKNYNVRLSLFVGNLPFNAGDVVDLHMNYLTPCAEEDSLQNFFSHCGEVTNVRIIRDKETSSGASNTVTSCLC